MDAHAVMPLPAVQPTSQVLVLAPPEDGTGIEQALCLLSAVQRASSTREPASKAQEDLLKFAIQVSTAAGEEEEQKPDLTHSEQWEQLSGFEYALRLCMLEAREEKAHHLVAVRDFAQEDDAVLWSMTLSFGPGRERFAEVSQCRHRTCVPVSIDL